MNNKTLLQVVKYDLNYYIRLILIIYAWTLGLIVLLPTIIHLIAGDGFLRELASKLALASTAAVFVNMALLFYFGFLTYERFSFFIQNGISRRTGWISKVISLVIMTLIANLYNIIISIFALVSGNGYDSVPYLSIYGHFFDSQWANMVGMMIITFLFMLSVAMFGMVVGSVFALLSRRYQRAVMIACPIIGILLLTILARVMRDKYMNPEAIENSIKFVVGYSRMSGYFNPFIPGTTMVILIILALIVSRWLSRKLRIKRGE